MESITFKDRVGVFILFVFLFTFAGRLVGVCICFIMRSMDTGVLMLFVRLGFIIGTIIGIIGSNNTEFMQSWIDT